MPDDIAQPLSAAAKPAALPQADRGAQRRRLLSIFAGILAVIAVAVIGWNVLVASHFANTDNAYVGGDLAQITPQLNAAVASVPVSETQSVKAGDVLVTLDDADAKIALARAQADYDGTVRRVEQTFATGRALEADIATRLAATRRAEALQIQARSALEKAEIDLRRREALQASGAVSAEELTIARNAFTAAQAAMNAANADIAQAQAADIVAKAQYDANQALIAGKDVLENPDVLSARARLDQAKLDLERTVIRAPFAGVVSQRHAQIGQRVKIGDSLMALVPVDQLFVDANFKEGQLAHVRNGQSVELTSDLYGSAVTFHGTVVGFAGGTGAATAIIPAQNATGNWIKVVQRLPVRIALQKDELAAHPLRIGLSMDATIDLRTGK